MIVFVLFEFAKQAISGIHVNLPYVDYSCLWTAFITRDCLATRYLHVYSLRIKLTICAQCIGSALLFTPELIKVLHADSPLYSCVHLHRNVNTMLNIHLFSAVYSQHDLNAPQTPDTTVNHYLQHYNTQSVNIAATACSTDTLLPCVFSTSMSFHTKRQEINLKFCTMTSTETQRAVNKTHWLVFSTIFKILFITISVI